MSELAARPKLGQRDERSFNLSKSEPVSRQRDEAILVGKIFDGRFEADAVGAWTVKHAAGLNANVSKLLSELEPASVIRVRMNGVTAFDTYGAATLARLKREAHAKGAELELQGLPDRFADLAARVDALGSPSLSVPSKRTWSALPQTIGEGLERLARDAANLLGLFGAVCQSLVNVLRRPSSFRLTSTVNQLDRVGWQAVPIIVLITLLIGGIIAQQGFFHFRKFGADQYVVDMVGILVLREIGVLLVAIMVAGRSGSSYTAELGSMKMREEIDALQTMGRDPIAVLILPRVLALIIALPALTFLGMMAALYGGGFVAWVYGGMHPDVFIARLREAISITHFKVGMIKAPFMALAIGIVACAEGLKVRGSAESLGLKTTASVVKSIFLVILLDGLFAMYFAAIGM